MRRTRREFLGAGLAGAVALPGGAPIAGRLCGGSASAAAGPDRFTYRGRSIALAQIGDTPVLQIDGVTMPGHVLSSIRVGGGACSRRTRCRSGRTRTRGGSCVS